MQAHYRKTDIINIENLQNTYELSDHDIINGYTPFNITELQHYNPIYSVFFDLDNTTVHTTTLKHTYAIHDLNTIIDTESGEHINKPVFIKFSPLLDPIKYMIGKYASGGDAIRKLPRGHIPSEPTENVEPISVATDVILPNIHPKLMDHNNASYIDCFFSYLSSQLLHKHGFVNCIDFYGSYLGIQEKYKMNIADDIEYLCTSRFFNENVGKLFKVSEDIHSDGNYGNGSRGNKRRLHIQSSLKSHNISVIDLDIETLDSVDNEPANECEDNEIVYEKPHNHSVTASSATSNSSNNSSVNYSTDESDSDEEEEPKEGGEDAEEEGEDAEDASSEDDGDSEDDTNDVFSDESEEEIFSYMNDFPIQLICLEKCDGTIDHLFEKSVFSKKEGAAALMQVVMTLITYQRAFSFTHNDLHTNNIMYVNTDAEFLYYRYNKKTYRVPTYGRIFKIIDFGRSIYRFSGKTFCSDSFSSGGDAATQYNCEPYMNEKKPRLDPNPSFDLCRLGCSIYDFLIDEESEYEMDAFQKTIHKWCCDDNGKNVLYKKDGEERYPSFKLYKMIARTVHHCSPQEQLNQPFFSQFVLSAKDVKKVGRIVAVMDIDDIPSYM